MAIAGCGTSSDGGSSEKEKAAADVTEVTEEVTTESESENASEALEKLSEDAGELAEEIGENVSEAAGDILGALGGAFSGTYEDVYNEYSAKLLEVYNAAKEELQGEIDSGKTVNDLAELVAEKGNALAETCDEGVSKMAEMAAINPLSTNDYSEWSTKLMNEYSNYFSDLYTNYSAGAAEDLQNMFDNVDLNNLDQGGLEEALKDVLGQ